MVKITLSYYLCSIFNKFPTMCMQTIFLNIPPKDELSWLGVWNKINCMCFIYIRIIHIMYLLRYRPETGTYRSIAPHPTGKEVYDSWVVQSLYPSTHFDLLLQNLVEVSVNITKNTTIFKHRTIIFSCELHFYGLRYSEIFSNVYSEIFSNVASIFFQCSERMLKAFSRYNGKI